MMVEKQQVGGGGGRTRYGDNTVHGEWQACGDL